MNSKRWMASVALVSLLGIGSLNCNPRFAGSLLGAAIVTAAIVGTAAIMAAHDAHYHDEYCGHQRRYHDGRWVYYYGSHWEYYDSGRWYYYGPPPQSPPPAVY
jgi:hypothetical protein